MFSHADVQFFSSANWKVFFFFCRRPGIGPGDPDTVQASQRRSRCTEAAVDTTLCTTYVQIHAKETTLLIICWSSVDQKEESAIYGEEKQVKAIHSSYISCELQRNLEQRGCRELLACSMVTNKEREGRRQRRENKNHATWVHSMGHMSKIMYHFGCHDQTSKYLGRHK